MLFYQVIRTAFRGIIANKMRTSLTMLGIIIGVGAIIAMLSLGEGAKRQVMESMSRFGTNVLRIRPGAAMLGHVRTGRVETLTMEDAEALRASVPGIKRLSPVVGSSTQVKYSNKNATTLVTGTTPEFIEINNFQVAEGHFFDQPDIKLVRRVAAIGATVRKELFGEGPAVGEEIKIEGQTFTVIAVMAAKGQSTFSDPDDQIFIPVTTSQRRVFFQDYVNDINIQVEDASFIPSVKEGIESVLRARHRIAPGVESDFTIRDFTEIMRAMQETTQHLHRAPFRHSGGLAPRRRHRRHEHHARLRDREDKGDRHTHGRRREEKRHTEAVPHRGARHNDNRRRHRHRRGRVDRGSPFALWRVADGHNLLVNRARLLLLRRSWGSSSASTPRERHRSWTLSRP